MANNKDIEQQNQKTSLINKIVHPSYFVKTHETMWNAWLVSIFVFANTGMFIATMYVNNCPDNNSGVYGKCYATFFGKLSFQPLEENPFLGPSWKTLQKLGALDYNKVVNDHQAWRLFACIWLHASVFHLLANMLFLIFIGICLEQQFGFIRVGAIYMISGIGGSVLSSLFLQSHILVGASFALFGLLGAMLPKLLANWTSYTRKAAFLIALAYIMVINLALGIIFIP